MPTLDENGHVPRDVYDRKDRPSWRHAAMECGVAPADVEARATTSERLNDIADDLRSTIDEYTSAIGQELELCDWAKPAAEIDRAGLAVADLYADFMAAADVARTLIDESREERS